MSLATATGGGPKSSTRIRAGFRKSLPWLSRCPPPPHLTNIQIATLLSCLAKAVRAPEGHDSTVYGTGRASPKSFYTHHVAAISSAIVRADALLVRNAAASLAFQLAHAPGPS